MENIAWIALFSVVGLAAWMQRGKLDTGPRRLLSASLALLALAVGLLSASLMMEVPDSRGLFAVLALVAVGVLIVRSVRKRQGTLAAETAGYTVRSRPARAARQAPSPLGYSGSRTVRDIENMEVQ